MECNTVLSCYSKPSTEYTKKTNTHPEESRWQKLQNRREKQTSFLHAMTMVFFYFHCEFAPFPFRSISHSLTCSILWCIDRHSHRIVLCTTLKLCRVSRIYGNCFCYTIHTSHTGSDQTNPTLFISLNPPFFLLFLFQCFVFVGIIMCKCGGKWTT